MRLLCVGQSVLGSAHLMLCRMVSLKRTVSCGTKPMCERREACMVMYGFSLACL